MNAITGIAISAISELAKKGIKALIESIDFNIQNAKSVNVEASMNEMRGQVYALEGYFDKLKAENDDLKVDKIKLEMKADRAEQKVKELQHEIDELNKYFKGE